MKEFDKWNIIKKKIDINYKYTPIYKERQIRWCRLGINIGFEQDGKGQSFSRPVLIIRSFNKRICWITPLTKTQNKNKYLIPITYSNNKKAKIIISQIRLIDTKRLDKLIGMVDKISFQKIKKSIKDLL